VSDPQESEWIEIVGQEILCFIAVPPEERKTWQKLLVTVRFQIGQRFCDLDDQFEQMFDYAAVEQIACDCGIQLLRPR
jgi:dihydroneopterin aldolase